MKAAHVLMAAGFLSTALGAGLSHFVMIGLIGVALILVAWGLLLAGFLLIRADSKPPWFRRIGGAALYIVGVTFLMCVAVSACSLAHDHVTGHNSAGLVGSALQWIFLGSSTVLPAFLIMVGLRFWIQWEWERCRWWAVAALSVVPATLAIFWSLAPVLPVSA